MYKLISLDDSQNGFYCVRCMRGSYRTASFLTSLGVVLALLPSVQCRSKAAPAAETGPTLEVEVLSLDASAGPRGTRPFIAGEELRITLRVEGGQPPYDLQVATSLGAPTLASGSTRVETTTSESIEVAMNLLLASEVPSGSYGLLIRVTDQQGIGASVRSTPFDLVGNDAPEAALDLSPAQLRVVDVAGRRRQSFYQGEEIQIQSLATPGDALSLAILAADDRPFMPVQRYEATTENFSIRLRIPRLARVGPYRIALAGPRSSAMVPLMVVGVRFSKASSPVLEELALFGGKDHRVPRGASLQRGEALQIEARVGGVQDRAVAKMRLRSATGKILFHEDLGEIIPADPDPAARTLLSATWTPSLSLSTGRHMLEIELIEADEVATLYREVVLR